jgi:putative spermidine/putrescine transport system permease protein
MAPALLVLLAVYAVPVGRLLLLSFGSTGWSLGRYAQVFGDRFVLATLGRTIRIAVDVTLICLLLGYPIAYLMLKSSPRRRGLIATLVIVPVWTSVLVRSYAWMVILGRQGAVNQFLQAIGLTVGPMPLLYNRFSVYVGMVHIMLPFMVLPLFSVMQRLDLGLVRAARSLGASSTAAFLWVFLPLSLPGVAAGSLLVFILSLGFFVTPALLGGLGDITYVMLIEKQVNELLNWELAAAMATVLLVVTLVLVVLYLRTLGVGSTSVQWVATALRAGSRLAAVVRGVRARGSRPRRLGRLRISLPALVGWPILALLILPILILLPLAFSASPFLQFPPSGLSVRWFANYFGRMDWLRPTWVSFQVALITTAVATPLGTLAALALVRGHFRGKELLMGFVVSPMVVPTIIVAIALYFQLARFRLVGTVTALVVGHLALAIPFVVVVVSGALRTVDESLEQAARSLGAGSVRAFLRVTLPLIRPGVLTGAFFAFLASFDDLVIALFVSGTKAATLPKRMWEGIRWEVDPTTAAVSALLIAFSLVLLGIAEVARVRASRARSLMPG